MELDEKILGHHVGELSIKREEQQQQRMWKILEDELMKRFLEKEYVKKSLPSLEQQVRSGQITPGQGADILLQKFFVNLSLFE